MDDEESRAVQSVLTSCERGISKTQLEESMKTLSQTEERIESFKDCLLEQVHDLLALYAHILIICSAG